METTLQNYITQELKNYFLKDNQNHVVLRQWISKKTFAEASISYREWNVNRYKGHFTPVVFDNSLI